MEAAIAITRPSDDGVRPLDELERAALLARMGVGAEPPSSAALERLQWAFLIYSPFHNIDLLAGRSGYPTPLDVESSIARVLEGCGGPCHVQATTFLALLRSLGYRAQLAAATIGAPGDHLVVVAEASGDRYVCDVGNGHPYARPFPVDRELDQQRFGWRFVTTPAVGGLTLRRQMSPSEWKTVYTVALAPRHIDDFAATIHHHHTKPGFGPFLTGLRAVRITQAAMLTLRDALYQRHSAWGISERPVLDEHAARALLSGPFSMGRLPIERAMETLRREGIKSWALARDDAPRPAIQFLVTVSTTNRPGALERLGRSMLRELARSGYGGWPERTPCRVLVIENSVDAGHREANRHTVEALTGDGLPVSLLDDGQYGRSIAASRIKQTQAIADAVMRGPRPDIIWMLDDDLQFAQLYRDHAGRLREGCTLDYFYLLDEMRATRPEISLALGGVTGDPPIRPDAVLRSQLFDLLANLERFAALAPESTYPHNADTSGFRLVDYYYDHRRLGDEHLSIPFLWSTSDRAGTTVRAQLMAFVDRSLGIPSGKTATRPLVLEAGAFPDTIRPGTRRGGNAAFFDLDACLQHSYPHITIEGVPTRRSDMVGASLLARDGSCGVYEAAFPLLHDRVMGDETVGFTGGKLDPHAARASILGEFYGVLLARSVMEAPPVGCTRADWLAALAAERADVIVGNLRAASELMDRLVNQFGDGGPGWLSQDREVAVRVKQLIEALQVLAGAYWGGADPSTRHIWLTSLRAELVAETRLSMVVQAHASLTEAVRA